MEHCHDGHRQRLLNTCTKAGLQNLSEVQILEYILTFVIPRKDTNPLAHTLLDKFGSLANVLDAKPKSLMAVSGLGETSAKKLSTFKQILESYVNSKFTNIKRIKNINDLYSFTKGKLMLEDRECIVLVGLDNTYKITSTETITLNKSCMVEVEEQKIIEFIHRNSIEVLLVLHNHPFGTCDPSPDDIDNSKFLHKICVANYIRLYDHIIYSNQENRIYSYSANKCYYEHELFIDKN